MAETVRILVLESKTTDYDLVCKSMPDYTLKQAKTRKDLLAALKAFQPDVILADYDHPRFNGLKTLQLVQEHAPLVPVIILMDTSDEEIAVNCMKAGANNYILKENIKRLEPAIIHALDERKLLLERKQTEDSLINNEKRFRAFLENGRDNISLLAADGTLLWESPAADHTLGYAHEEFKGHNIFELMHPEDQGWVQELFGKLILEPGKHQQGSFRLKHSNGSWRWVEATASNLLEEPVVNAIVVNYRDITELKEADARMRESEERFSKAFNLGPAALSIAHLEGGIFLAVNEAYLNLYGYEYAEVVGHTPLELGMYPDEREAALVTKLLQEQTSFRDLELRTLTKSGEVRTVLSSGESIELGGEKYMLSFTTDITEQKRVMDDLNHSHSLLSATLESTTDGILVVATDGQVRSYNKKFLELWRIPNELAAKKDDRLLLEFVLGQLKDPAAFIAKVEALYQSPDDKSFDKLEFKDGRVFERYSQGQRSGDSILGRVWSFRDITERKRAENILKSREAIMSAVASSAQQLIRADKWEEVFPNILAKLGRAAKVDRAYLFENHRSPDGTLLTSQRYEWVSLGTEPQIDNPDLQNMSLEKVGLAHMASELENDNVVYGNLMDFPVSEQEFLSQENIFSLAVVPIFVGEQWWGFIGFDECKSKRTWESTEIDALKAAAGNLGSSIQRQIVEQSLKESEDRYRDLIENSCDLICTHDLEGKILSVNSWAETTLGYPMEDMLNMNLKDFLAPRSLDRFGTYLAVIKRNGSARGQMFVKTRTGEQRIWEYNNTLRTTGVEKPIVRGNARDITEQKHAEEERARQSENLFTLYTLVQEINSSLDLKDIYASTHRAAFRLMTGDVFVISILDEINQEIEDVYLWEKDKLWEEQRYPFGQDLPAYIISTNKPLRINQWDETHNKMTGATSFGYEENDIRSVLAVPLLHPAGKTFGMLSIQSYAPDVYTPEHEQLLILLANQVSNSIENAQLYDKAQSELAERKRTEEALQESQLRYKDAFENSPISLWEGDYSQVKIYFDQLRSSGVTDFQDYFDQHPEAVTACVEMVKVLDVNQITLDLMRIDDKSQVLGSLSRSLNKDAYPSFITQLISMANGNLSYKSDDVFYNEKGEKRTIFVSVSVVPGSEDILNKVLISILDITDRKQAEEALQESEERFSGIVNSAMDGIISINSNQRIVLFNTSAERLFGCTAEEAIGQSVERFMPERFRDSHSGHITNFAQTGATTRAMGNLNAIYGLRADGTEFPIEATISRIKTGSEHLYTVILRDITERKLANDALRASEERFRLLFDRMMDGVYRSTHEGKFVDVNPAMVKMFGYASEEEMLKVDIKNDLYFAPDERGSHILDTGQEETDTYRMRRKDGSEIWVEDHGSYVHDEQGNIILHEGILRNITERKRAEEILNQNEMLLHESQKIAGLGHYDFNVSTGNWESSETLNKVLGIDWDYLTDLTSWANLVHPSQREEMISYFTDHVLRDHKSFDRKYLIIRFNDGQERWVHGLGKLVFDENGNLNRMIGTIQDITERKQVENEMSRHLAEMEALYENGLAVSRLLQPGEIGYQVIKTFEKHLSWHHVAIRLMKNEDDLVLIAWNKPGLSELEKSEMERHFNSMAGKVGQGLSGWVVQTGQPVRTGDVHAHPQYIDTQAGIQSGLYMPLKIGERVIGVISVESEKVDAFSAEDERLLATLASQAAVALENAHLYQAAQLEITERIRAEKALRTSETHYRDLADSITDVMFEMDQNLHVTHWNKSSELLTGISQREAIGRSAHQIFGDSKEQTEVEKIYLNVLLNRAPKSFETFLNLSEERRAYEITAYPSMNGISVIAKDVTERKLAEMVMVKRFELMNFSAHNSLEDVMQKMLDEITELVPSPIGFFHFMEEDQITPGRQMWSSKALELFNVSASEGHHRALDQAGVWADAVRERRPVIQNDYASLPNKKGLPQGHEDISRELVIPIIRNERIMAVMGIGNKLDGYTQQNVETAVRFADHAWDIIERTQMELTLADERNQLAARVEERTSDLSHANSNLARALRVKDEFLANMSHELRTPLNAILGLSESLTEKTAGPLNEKQEKYLTTISESGHHLLSLINDILDLAKIDAGQITLNINKVDVKSVCEASLRMIKQLASKKNQDATLDIDENVGLIWADERRLKQMLVNLLSNAVKFTPQDGKLGIEVRGDQSRNRVSFAIWDNGIGIKDNDMPLLFQPFIQLDGGLDREAAGTGLGLALVAQMARLHGGSVTVESVPNQGSRFIITLPWEPALTPDAIEKMRETGKLRYINPDDKNKHTILLIEDTQEVTMMLKDYLENAGYIVNTAQDGIEGLDLAKSSHPDLILMDVQMPRLNGIEATKRLRADPEFKHTPIIALTALAMPNDRDLCLAAGMDEYISKPVNLKRLLKIIQGFLSNKKETDKPQ